LNPIPSVLFHIHHSGFCFHLRSKVFDLYLSNSVPFNSTVIKYYFYVFGILNSIFGLYALMGNPKLGSFEQGVLGFSSFFSPCEFFLLTVTVSLILVHVFALRVFFWKIQMFFVRWVVPIL
jgi:hypothetical protein